MESKGNVNKHHKNRKIDSFETWHIKKTTQIGLWSHCCCYVGQFIYAFAILTVFVLMQFQPSILKLSTQHPSYFWKLSTQHQPAITRIENWAILPTQDLQFSYTFIRAFSKISAYTKTVQFYSTNNTSMNNFLAQSSSPCLMLGGIPPASLSEGWFLTSPHRKCLPGLRLVGLWATGTPLSIYSRLATPKAQHSSHRRNFGLLYSCGHIWRRLNVLYEKR